MDLNFFNTVENLEPKCKNCGARKEYGVTTRWDEVLETHICLKCGKPVD